MVKMREIIKGGKSKENKNQNKIITFIKSWVKFSVHFLYIK